MRYGPPLNFLDSNDLQLPDCCLRVGSIFAPCEIGPQLKIWGKRSGRAASLNGTEASEGVQPAYEGLHSKYCVLLPATEVETVTGKRSQSIHFGFGLFFWGWGCFFFVGFGFLGVFVVVFGFLSYFG